MKLATRCVAGALIAIAAFAQVAQAAPGNPVAAVPVKKAAAPVQLDRQAVEDIVRAYILEHPEILPEAMALLEERETNRKVTALITDLEKPFKGAWLGNPDGDVVVVEFFDYACGYCRRSVPDVEKLLATDPNVKVVFREFPILGPASLDAARVSLAAASSGKYQQVHAELFGGRGLDDSTIQSARRKAGIKLPKDLAPLDAELRNNNALARQIGITGTPAFIVGGKLISGAVGYDVLKRHVDEARARKHGAKTSVSSTTPSEPSQ